MNTNFPEGTEDAPEVPVSAGEAPKQVRGRPFTKENAKRMALSAAAAKKRRKEARMKMLSALTDKLDLGEELYKAMTTHDFDYLQMIVVATRLTGLQHDQSDEGKTQNLNVNAKADVKAKTDNSIRFIIEDAKPEA